MKYITLNELNNTIRKNFSKIPHDIDFVIGIPRSGMIAGSIISEFLNVPLIDIDSLCNGSKPTGGNRLTLVDKQPTNKVLVIDDTCYSGSSIKGAKDKLKDNTEYKFIYAAVYLEGNNGEKELDFYLDDVRKYTKQFPNVIYEWNIFHHYPHIMLRCIFDIDGVLCCEPPDERLQIMYEDYIKHAKPLFVPTVPIGKIVTYRLIKYEKETAQWLYDNGIQCNKMIMFNANTYEDRKNTGITPEQMKAAAYMIDKEAILFIESDDKQAKEIYKLSGKPVLCIESNILYGNE